MMLNGVFISFENGLTFIMSTTLKKYAAESRLYQFDFSQRLEITEGDVISSAVISASPAGLSLGECSVDNSIVTANMGDGVSGISYAISVIATLGSGTVLECNGVLVVN